MKRTITSILLLMMTISIFAQQSSSSSGSKAVDIRPGFKAFATRYVNDKMEIWQKKGEFEKTSDWQERMSTDVRKSKIESLVKEAEEMFINSQKGYIPIRCEIGKYDPDNEVYLIKDPRFGDLLVPVPIANAPEFKQNFRSAIVIPRYFINNDKLSLASKIFRVNGVDYAYNNSASLDYKIAEIDYSGLDINIKFTDYGSASGNQNISNVRTYAKSDIDFNIPETKFNNDKTFAVVIANENYIREARVSYALNDGYAFKEYCKKTLGIPYNNIRYVPDATLGSLISTINWMTDISEHYQGEANLIFYYAGHGIPGTNGECYMLPSDGDANNTATCFSMDNLYAQLGDCKAKSSLVLLDACFSGCNRDGQLLIEARGIRRVVNTANPESLKGNTVVISATNSDEIALPYKEKQHGMFTYFLLKNIQENKGDSTLGEIYKYVYSNVSQRALIDNSRQQTPSVAASAQASSWQTTKLHE